MEIKHTPGKWIQSHRKIPNDPEGMYSTQVYTEDGQEICSLAWYPKPKEEGVIDGKSVLITGTYREANAKLIAAAPDLLEACNKAMHACQDNLKAYNYKNEAALLDAYKALELAIKKATE